MVNRKKNAAIKKHDIHFRKLFRILAAGAVKINGLERELAVANRNLKEIETKIGESTCMSPKLDFPSFASPIGDGSGHTGPRALIRHRTSGSTMGTRSSFSSAFAPAKRPVAAFRPDTSALDQQRAPEEEVLETIKRPSIDNESTDGGTRAESTLLLSDTPWRWGHDVLVVIFTALDLIIAGYILALGQWHLFPSVSVVVILVLSSILHCVTVALNFNTAVLSGWELIGDESDEVSLIRRMYLRGWFIIDSLTLIPVDMLVLPISVKAHRVLWYVTFLI
eukprot:TRINITY_DN38154_c0_g1_i1.p1 TRINITY_DN38154_c0_g1~~TRINITY_DN38154_c0_g1_i1.p1  ORF type:complete len:279 (+),score=27.81 TRINITY_DN38154_c0_g1_i1:140-976(+)